MDEAERLVCELKDAVACAVTMKGPHTIEERAALVDQTTAAVLAAMRKGGVPDGWQLVPKVLTPEMVEATRTAENKYFSMPNAAEIEPDQMFWEAMLAAAPQPPATKE